MSASEVSRCDEIVEILPLITWILLAISQKGGWGGVLDETGDNVSYVSYQ